MKCAALVYQAGIANVFEMPSKDRLIQADFRSCEYFCRGLIAAGVNVKIWSCNMVGDIKSQIWAVGLDDCPFREQAHPPRSPIGRSVFERT